MNCIFLVPHPENLFCFLPHGVPALSLQTLDLQASVLRLISLPVSLVLETNLDESMVTN